MDKKKIQELISGMTLEEKAGLCSGADFWHTKAVERLGIPATMVSDGPHGLRKQDQEGDHLGINDSIKAVCYPAASVAGGSGLEKTQAALALRVVLANMSNLSRPPFIVLDEILGSVAAENYDDMKKLYDKIVLQYDFVLHICHIDLDWYDGNVIYVTKVNNIFK